jgi:hypothetical protein
MEAAMIELAPYVSELGEIAQDSIERFEHVFGRDEIIGYFILSVDKFQVRGPLNDGLAAVAKSIVNRSFHEFLVAKRVSWSALMSENWRLYLQRIDEAVFLSTRDLTGMNPDGSMIRSSRIELHTLRSALLQFVSKGIETLEKRYGWLSQKAGRVELLRAFEDLKGVSIQV